MREGYKAELWTAPTLVHAEHMSALFVNFFIPWGSAFPGIFVADYLFSGETLDRSIRNRIYLPNLASEKTTTRYLPGNTSHKFASTHLLMIGAHSFYS